jgi:hypothetical protein
LLIVLTLDGLGGGLGKPSNALGDAYAERQVSGRVSFIRRKRDNCARHEHASLAMSLVEPTAAMLGKHAKSIDETAQGAYLVVVAAVEL